MAGNGAAPIRSPWLSDCEAGRGAAILYGKISFGDNDTDEGTLWGAWFFGTTAGSFIPAWSKVSNLPVLGTGVY